MANSTTGNPWVLDTAGSIITTPFRCKLMVWTPTTTGDDILLVDNGGNTLWSYKAIAGDSNQSIPYELPIDGVVNGLTITTIDHGTLYVYIR